MTTPPENTIETPVPDQPKTISAEQAELACDNDETIRQRLAHYQMEMANVGSQLI